MPVILSNICFGRREKQHLFITATTGLYVISLNRAGAQVP